MHSDIENLVSATFSAVCTADEAQTREASIEAGWRVHWLARAIRDSGIRRLKLPERLQKSVAAFL